MTPPVKFRLPHNYSVEGKDVPSFSEIIDFAGRKKCRKCEGAGCGYCKDKGYESWYTEESSERGTWIHEACFSLLQNTLNVEKAFQEYPERMNCVGSFYRFILDQGLEGQPYIIESKLYSDEINTAGTPDILFPVQKTGLELKSGAFKESHKFQIAVYSHLVTWNISQGWLKEYGLKPGPWRWILVYLDDKGYDAKEYPGILAKYLRIFKSFQVTYSWNTKL